MDLKDIEKMVEGPFTGNTKTKKVNLKKCITLVNSYYPKDKSIDIASDSEGICQKWLHCFRFALNLQKENLRKEFSEMIEFPK